MNDPNDLLAIIAGRDTTGLIEVRCRNPHTGRITERDWFPVTERARCSRFIARHSGRLDVYVGVAPRRARGGVKALIERSWLVYVDCDSSDAAERARAFAPQPTLIVRSGTGDNIHAYWSLSEPVPVSWFERANRRLSYHLGADVKVTDAARILRPPGSLNHKHDPPVRVTVEHVNSSAVVPVSRLVKNLPDPPANPHVPRRPRDDVYADDPLLGVSADRYYAVLTGRPVSAGNVTCPFMAHNEGRERTPSMRLYATTFNCFGCCVGGGIYQFASHLWDVPSRGAGFLEIKRRLTDALGLRG